MKNIKLCLVDIKVPNMPPNTPLNLLTLASYCVNRGVIPKENILIVNSNRDDDISRILAFRPDLIGFSSTSLAYSLAIKIAKQIKKQLNVPIIVGGHHISGDPHQLDKVFSAGVIGEGEGALEDIVKLLISKKEMADEYLHKIKNLVYFGTNGNIKINPCRELLKGNEIPKYCWDLLDKGEIVRYETAMNGDRPVLVLKAQVFSARGCPYNCSFCARQVVWSVRGFRQREIDDFIEDVEYLYNKYHITAIEVLDDTFAVSKERVKKIIQAFREKGWLGKILLPWIFVRANLIDKEFVVLLKELGVLSVFIGAESGSEKVLKYLKGGSLKVEQIVKATELFRDQGIGVQLSFMIFIPGEGKRDLNATYQLAKNLGVLKNITYIRCFINMPFPGTKIWNDHVIAKGMKTDKIRWDKVRYVIPHPEKSIAKHVFFRNKLNDTQLDFYWKRMYELVKAADERRVCAPGYKELAKKEEELNDKLDFRLKLKYRFDRIRYQPSRVVTHLLKPKVWTNMYAEIKKI